MMIYPKPSLKANFEWFGSSEIGLHHDDTIAYLKELFYFGLLAD